MNVHINMIDVLFMKGYNKFDLLTWYFLRFLKIIKTLCILLQCQKSSQNNLKNV